MNEQPKTRCCNAPIYYKEIKRFDGSQLYKNGSTNHFIIWCSDCGTIIDRDGKPTDKKIDQI